MSRAAGLDGLTAVLERELPGLRAAALVLTADRAAADALLAHVLERVVAAWPRYARAPDPVHDVCGALVREAVRTRPETGPETGPAALPSAQPGALSGAPDLVRAVAGVPVSQRAVLVLRDLSGVPLQRAAAVLGLPVAQAAALHRRAVRSLGDALGEELEEPAGPPEDDDGAIGAARATGGAVGAEDVVELDPGDPDDEP